MYFSESDDGVLVSSLKTRW